ncbi:SGNH/GDSL hydrolase family protein [Lysobacter sp. A03]|uniref:SGNH/GDSL hydrolase family protein n=1 Tax=Lysobacter sp. A03 TaxID=1199154 RepID=UPI0005B73D48|nr:SGNH/GDSL hydrolase family protein [Lysobacter sp. A03]KIQ97522.1 Lysophospholipase L1 [Lysobacter sp. A03]
MAAPTSTAVNWLALGDSYTIGEGVGGAERWPELLADRLARDGIAVTPPRVIAATGWTTDELSTAMDIAEPLGHWDLVSLLIGVNNQYRGRSVADYRGEFHALLKRAIALAGARPERVLVLSIPDWGVTAFATAQGRDAEQIAAEIDQYNGAAATLCARHGVAFVDITPVSRERGGEVAMLVDDGLHPSQAMYALWADAALPVVARMLDGTASR